MPCHFTGTVMTDFLKENRMLLCYNINSLTLKGLTLSVPQTKTGTCAISVDPDETARHEPSHQHLYCKPFRF